VRLIGQVDGVAASAATGILAVCDEVSMGPGTQYMIHNSQGMAMGDRNDLRALADLMEKVDGGILQAYMDKSGKPEATIRGWMDAETWFTAEQAVDNGFADRINTYGKKAKASVDWKLDAFANAPKALHSPPSRSRKNLQPSLWLPTNTVLASSSASPCWPASNLADALAPPTKAAFGRLFYFPAARADHSLKGTP
jgi:hypothetical protein